MVGIPRRGAADVFVSDRHTRFTCAVWAGLHTALGALIVGSPHHYNTSSKVERVNAAAAAARRRRRLATAALADRLHGAARRPGRCAGGLCMLDDGWQRGTVARLCSRGACSHVVSYIRQTSELRGTADTLFDAASYGSRWCFSRRPFVPGPPAPSLSLVGGSSQLPARGREVERLSHGMLPASAAFSVIAEDSSPMAGARTVAKSVSTATREASINRGNDCPMGIQVDVEGRLGPQALETGDRLRGRSAASGLCRLCGGAARPGTGTVGRSSDGTVKI